MLFSNEGKVVRFKEGEEVAVLDENGNPVLDEEGNPQINFKGVRPMGRGATGVRGIKLEEGQKVVSLIVPKGDGAILTVTENGYGKRTELSEYPSKSRATKGVVSIKVSERNGAVVGAVQVGGNDVGRNTQGVTIIRTASDEKVVGLQRIVEIQGDEDEVELDVPVVAEGDSVQQEPLEEEDELEEELDEDEELDDEQDED